MLDMDIGVEASLLKEQHFMVNFIMSNYLGPDVMSDNPRYSASQRLSSEQQLSPYSADDLGPSFLSIFELESLYYYAMRNANPNLIFKRKLLHMYLRGNLLLPNSELPDDIEQFTTFFPSNLHQQQQQTIIKGILLIQDPVTSHIKQENLDKFLRLSGNGNLKMNDIDEFLSYQYEYRNTTTSYVGSTFKTNNFKTNNIVLTGTAKKGRGGPPVGVVDIGVGKSAYFFQVALPGVNKTSILLSLKTLIISLYGCLIYIKLRIIWLVESGELSCEVECDGKVKIQSNLIKEELGVNPNMNLQQISFSLPGPVDPRLFAPKLFTNDGIFEAVIVKAMH